jgi:pyridinium-3,5-bisthiocarboxylic acid mononucleotide nickel chelatase
MILWLNPFSGISGDMILGALLDLGAPTDEVRAAIASTGITGWTLTTEPVRRAGLTARRALVRVDDQAPGRRAAELLAMAQAARPAAAGQLAAAAISALAEAEGRLHGVPADQVHLHELGGVDTIVDTVGVGAALHALGVSAVWSAPLGLGAGVVEMAHGQFPAPAPATVALLDGAQVTGITGTGEPADPAGSTEGLAGGPAASKMAWPLAGETVTPTGAALLRAMGCRYGPMPALRVSGSGYGAGARDVPGRPNVLPVLLGEPVAERAAVQPQDPPAGHAGDASLNLAVDGLAGRAGRAGGHPAAVETLLVVETTVDDVTGEVLGELPGLLLAAGALDVWITAVTGKKGRPAHVVTALCRPDAAGRVQARLLGETGSLGARQHQVRREALPRQETEVTVHGHGIRVKLGPHRAKPEHEDVAAAARATGLALHQVTWDALRQLPAVDPAAPDTAGLSPRSDE